MAKRKIEPPDEARMISTELAEHEVLLSFNGDSDAVLFAEWWNLKGFIAFQQWAEKQPERP